MADSLRIALLTYATKPRGSVMHTLELAMALHRLGHRPTVLALDKEGLGLPRSVPFAVGLVPAAAGDRAIDQLIRQRIGEFVRYLQVKGEIYDLYHAQDCIGANALATLKTQGQIPHFVRTVHHIEAFESPYLQDCQDKSIRLPDRCFCVSQVWQTALQIDYGIEAVRVVNGVDADRFTPQPTGIEKALAERYGLTGHPRYLTVGGIEPRKNSLRLLQAFAQVRETHPQAQLIIAGGATLFDYQPYRQRFFDLADALNLGGGDALCLPGVVPEADLPALYRAADAFVFPSTKEGWGLVVLEAIASGLPVVTANQPPFTEFLNSEQALLVPPDSVAAIAAAMVQILQPSVRADLLRACQGLAQGYTWEACAQKHLEVYRQVSKPR